MGNITTKTGCMLVTVLETLLFLYCHILPATVQGPIVAQDSQSCLLRLQCVWFSPLCSIRFFWRRHPQLRSVELNFISLFWPSLPNGIQAAYEEFDRDLVFLFKGNCLGFNFISVLPEGRRKGLFCGPPQIQRR